MAKCLSSSALNALRCEKCKNYLSAAPIIFTSDKYFCGRCKATGPRARAYETLAKEVLFPCINDKAGCKRQLSFEMTLEHEGECEYATILCPSLNCSKTIGRKTILEHFQKTHQNLLVKGDGFSIPKKTDFLQNRGIILDDKFYLIQIRGFADKGTFSLSLKTVFDKKAIAYNLVIQSKNGNKIVKKEQKSTLFQLDDSKVDDRFSHEEIESVLGSPDYTFDVKFSSNEKKIDENLLEDFECIVCQEYMIPPIYICEKGHSLCDSCVRKIFECPVCRSFFEGARNFALERLAERITYPCKNRPKCDFTGNVNNIRQHETQCGGPINSSCPLVFKKNLPCEWSGPFCDILKHTKEVHPMFSFVRPGKIFFRDVSKELSPMDCQVLAFDQNHFLLSIECKPQEYITFKVNHIESSCGQDPKYRFVLETIDQENSGRERIKRCECYGFDSSYDSEDCYGKLFLPIGQFLPVDSSGRVYLKIDIERVD